jgi:hypothetical protein
MRANSIAAAAVTHNQIATADQAASTPARETGMGAAT